MVAKAGKLLERVPHGDEGKLREKMRKDGNAIASTQSQITEVLARMKTADPRIEEEHPASVAEADEGAGTALRSSFEAGKRMDDFCYYYTCLYVALTLFHGATIRNESDQGKAEQEKLKEVLVALNKVKQHPNILADSVRSMCSFLGVPCDVPCTSSDKAEGGAAEGGAANAAATVQEKEKENDKEKEKDKEKGKKKDKQPPKPEAEKVEQQQKRRRT